MTSEDELIEYVKPLLKAKGFRKKNKRWTKNVGEFTLSFLLQGSCYNKEDFYIRPGVYIEALKNQVFEYYDTFFIQIPNTTTEEILNTFFNFCDEWTNKTFIKKRLIQFLEWESRNPLEKRMAGLCYYTVDPPPTEVFFTVPEKAQEYILKLF